jgi:hypothetical protein
LLVTGDAFVADASAKASSVFWFWDLVATARGHWWFVGFRILGLPIAEWLFFPVVAFVSIFAWESVRYFTRRRND